MALTLDDLQEILIQSGFGTNDRAKAIQVAREYIEDIKEEKEKNPRSKKKFTVLVRGEEELAEKIQQAWIVQTEDEQDDNELIQRLTTAAARHNENQKRKKHIVELWRDVFAWVKSKTLKDNDIKVAVKTKEPVRVIFLSDEKVKFYE